MSQHEPCVKCGRQSVRRKARGLCKPCYNTVQRAGALEDWPLSRRRNSVVTEEVMWFSEQGIPVVQWPGRLDMTIMALERALYRAGRNDLANQVGRIRRQEA